MRVCCLLSDAEARARARASEAVESAIVAWSRALDAERLTLDAFRLLAGNERTFDVVLIEASADSLETVHALSRLLRPDRSCLLVAHVSRSLPSEALQLARFREALSQADLVIAPQVGVCVDIRRKLGIRALPLAHPQPWANAAASANAEAASSRRWQLSVIGRPGYSRRAFLRDVGVVAFLWATLRYRLRFSNVESPLSELASSLRRSRLVYLACSLEDGGAFAAYCASVGAVLLAPLAYDSARLTFPYTTFPTGASAMDKRRRSLLLLWLLSSAEFVEFFRDTARKRLSLLRDEDCRVQFFRTVQYLAPELEYVPQPSAKPSLWAQIRRRSGPRTAVGGVDSCVLVCLVRNGREHLPSFLRHYRALGISELVFIDNGSDDGTLELLEREPDVTVYETSLSHKDFETQIRRLVIEQHCRQRWCLNVDVDELFDYPMSDRLELCGLLRYLRQRGATAMVSHMLDMYGSTNRRFDEQELDLREAYPHYDVSHLERADYHATEQLAYCDANALQAEIPSFSGGIRQRVFGSKAGGRYLLIKHPLIFLDGQLEPVTHPHYSNHATVADVTGVLYHYKFTPSFKAKALESQASGRYVKFAQQQYEQYLTKLGRDASIAIATAGTRRLKDVNDLVPLGFVRVSDEYRSFVEENTSRPTSALEKRGDANERRHTTLPDHVAERTG